MENSQENNEKGQFVLPDRKMTYKTVVIKTLWR